jgi:hypothetical protein
MYINAIGELSLYFTFTHDPETGERNMQTYSSEKLPSHISIIKQASDIFRGPKKEKII